MIAMYWIVPTIKRRKLKDNEFDQKQIIIDAARASTRLKNSPLVDARVCPIEATKYWATNSVMICVI